MKKRFIAMCLSVVLISGVSCCCGKKTEASTTEKPICEHASDYAFFETMDSEEYIGFLNELDCSSNREIIDISNGTYSRDSLGFKHVYTVTYKIREVVTQHTNIQYEYLLFETQNEQEYLLFLDELSDEYEIVDISNSVYVPKKSWPNKVYTVTYRKPL